MSSSEHADNKTNDILIIAKGPTRGLDNTVITSKENFIKGSQRKFLIIMEATAFYFLMPQ